MAQRSPYAGNRPIGVPELASRFRTDQATQSTPTTVPLANRVGEGDTQSTQTTQRLPVDALGDAQLVDRLNQWPREHQPFWLLNAEAIEQHRNQQPTVNLANRFTGSETIPAKPTNIRSPFAGSSRF